ncbi:MAG: NMD3-related protein [Methanomassiliicoccales archaeon]|jgi:nonsense-mediated mRNA decay protein 3|nr:NMD3-related protein [Methanomassiliicoccales archaeon]
MFCVKCGREGPTYENLCASCFIAKTRFSDIPDHVDLVQCALCGEFLFDRNWKDYASIEDAAEAIALQSINLRKGAWVEDAAVTISQRDERNYNLAIDLTIRFENLVKNERLETTVRVKKGLCQRCSRIKGSYYESIIQIRTRGRAFPPKEKESLLSEIEALVETASRKSRDAFISKVKEEQGGFDVYLSSSSLGKSVSREISRLHGAEFKESAKLVGQKDGKNIKRVTYLVRLPSYRIGDVIRYNGRMYYVEGIGVHGARLVDLETHEPMMFGSGELESAPVVVGREEISETVVLREEKKEIEVLDPTTMKPVVVKKPHSYTVKERKVKVVVHENQVFLIPHVHERSRGE